MTTLLITIIMFGMALIALGIFFPRLFKRRCGYCNEYHQSRYYYWIGALGRRYCMRNGLIFTRKQCLDAWLRENYVCSQCKKHGPKVLDTPMYKHKRDYYYFCSTECMNVWKSQNPELVYEGHKRHAIPSDLRKIVWNRDGGVCVRCGSDQNLEYDHIIPVSKGGATTADNLELLCATCNRSKSDRIE